MHNTYAANSNCIVDFDKDGAGFVGNVGQGSWSLPYDITYTHDMDDKEDDHQVNNL